jgi:hypothetical protein
MSTKRWKLEEVVAELRQVQVLHSQGLSMTEAILRIGMSEVSSQRWRKGYGGHCHGQRGRIALAP